MAKNVISANWNRTPPVAKGPLVEEAEEIIQLIKNHKRKLPRVVFDNQTLRGMNGTIQFRNKGKDYPVNYEIGYSAEKDDLLLSYAFEGSDDVKRFIISRGGIPTNVDSPAWDYEKDDNSLLYGAVIGAVSRIKDTVREARLEATDRRKRVTKILIGVLVIAVVAAAVLWAFFTFHLNPKREADEARARYDAGGPQLPGVGVIYQEVPLEVLPASEFDSIPLQDGDETPTLPCTVHVDHRALVRVHGMKAGQQVRLAVRQGSPLEKARAVVSYITHDEGKMGIELVGVSIPDGSHKIALQVTN